MKYCSKCGKELVGEAVVCTNCGCAVELTLGKNSKPSESKIQVAFVLNIIALIVSFALITFCGLIVSEGGLESNFSTLVLFGFLFVIVLFGFILSIVAKSKINKNRNKKNFAWIYLAYVILEDISYTLLSFILFFDIACGVAMLVPVGPILQTIAAIKFLQATKE